MGEEVWVADIPTHKIYQNGEKFMGQEIQKRYVYYGFKRICEGNYCTGSKWNC